MRRNKSARTKKTDHINKPAPDTFGGFNLHLMLIKKFYVRYNSGEIVTFIPDKPITQAQYFALKHQYQNILNIGTVRLSDEKLHGLRPNLRTIQPPK